jgi:glycosyltransferase involved in cell wall biosynthesis
MVNPRNRRTLKVSAIIPAYNEARNLPRVLRPLRRVPAVREIIVVSDGSTDDTAAVARDFGGVKVISLPRNVGKTKAIARGVAEAEHRSLLFCDADLINLRSEHISGLVKKYCEGYAMVIMDKGSQPWVFRDLLKSAPAVSGTRILDRRHFTRIPFLEGDRFQFEIRINDYFLDNDLAITVVPAEEVYDPRKFVKYPFWEGLLLDFKGGSQVLASDGPSSIWKNLVAFWRIKGLVHARLPSAGLPEEDATNR